MTASTPVGNYSVLLDAGFVFNVFTLDVSYLDGTDVLDGDINYFDVTEYVTGISVTRGRDNVRQPIDTGQATITIHDTDGRFSLVNPSSPYWDTARDRLGFQPTRRVQVLRDNEPLFVGQITEYTQDIELDGDSRVTVRATDDLIRLSNVKVNAHTPAEELSGARIGAILDRPEVNLFVGAGKRVVDDGVAGLGPWPVEQDVSVRDYFDRIQASEYGRTFMDRQGRFVFQERVGRAQRLTPLMLSDVGDGGVPFVTFEIRNDY